MKTLLAFDDVIITPQYSTIMSRSEVNTKVSFLGEEIFPVISSNMDSVTSIDMAKAMASYGARGCLHRFQSIEENVNQFIEIMQHGGQSVYASVGVGEKELDRAVALNDVGANIILLDVAHGASSIVVKQVQKLQNILSEDTKLIVGNFANAQSVRDFLYHLGNKRIDAIKVGIGGGSACLTRVVTGAGAPTLSSLLDCANLNIPMIADGGIRNSGDFCKALASGATAVMLGGMLVGTSESPGTREYVGEGTYVKKYRGSASLDSYKAQNKEASHRTSEGDSFRVPYVGPVAGVLQQLEAGLRSSMSYVGASTLDEYSVRCELNQITNAGFIESTAHGKHNG